MYKNALSLSVGKVDKLIMIQFNLSNWSLAKFHKIWYKSVNNPNNPNPDPLFLTYCGSFKSMQYISTVHASMIQQTIPLMVTCVTSMHR